MTPEEYCQNKAAKSGSSFYYSFLFLPDNQRKAITALYAFCREVDDVVDDVRDPQVKSVKLQWWHDELAALFNGQPNHPVTKALQPWLLEFNLQQQYFTDIIYGMAMDIEPDFYATFDDLYQYCYRAAGVVGILSAHIFGFKNPDTLKYAENLGIAFQLTNILRDVYEDSRRSRIYIPLDELTTCNIKPADIINYPDTPDKIALIPLFKQQAERALHYYDKAFSYLHEQDRYPQRSGIIMAAIYQTTLTEIIKSNYPVMEQRTRIAPIRKLWIAWRTARSEKKRHNHYVKTS